MQQIPRGQGLAGARAKGSHLKPGCRACTPALFSLLAMGSHHRLLNGAPLRVGDQGPGSEEAQDSTYQVPVYPTCYQNRHVLCQAAREDARQLGEETEAALAGPDIPIFKLPLQGLDHKGHLWAGEGGE